MSRLWADSMAQWQDCLLEFRVQSKGEYGVQFTYEPGQPPKTFISCSLLSVALLQGEITLKSQIHFITSFISCLVRLYVQKDLLICLSHPLKSVANLYKKVTFIKFIWLYVYHYTVHCTVNGQLQYSQWAYKHVMVTCAHSLALPMLRLLLSKAQGRNHF